ncbi:MAG TPA: hypothetical protein VLX28_06495 [Thermoanaerobaculia bacterium]|nr:hypothetical protein [Thermoanaerobaculia bacterium]
MDKKTVKSPYGAVKAASTPPPAAAPDLTEKQRRYLRGLIDARTVAF